MGYADYLKNLLAPTGIYELECGVGAQELCAIGGQLDMIFKELEKLGAEMTLPTALDYGISEFAGLLPYSPAGTSIDDARRAVMALLRIRGGYFSLHALQDTVSGCGVSATVDEDVGQTVVVSFPGVMGIPNDFRAAQKQIEQILPCHLAVQYVFVYALWSALEAAFPTWGDVDAADVTFDYVEKYK